MQIHQSIHLGYVCFSGQWLPIYKHRPWCGVGGLQNHYDFFDERRHHSMETAHRLWGCQGMRNPSLPTSIASRRYVCTCPYTAPQMYIQAVVMNIICWKARLSSEYLYGILFISQIVMAKNLGLRVRNPDFAPQLCLWQAMHPRLDNRLVFWNLSFLICEMGLTGPRWLGLYEDGMRGCM